MVLEDLSGQPVAKSTGSEQKIMRANVEGVGIDMLNEKHEDNWLSFDKRDDATLFPLEGLVRADSKTAESETSSVS